MNRILTGNFKITSLFCLTLLVSACGGAGNDAADSLPGANVTPAVDINSGTESPNPTPTEPTPNDPVPVQPTPTPTPTPTTGAATLNWMPPTENMDGSTLEDLAGYKIYYGTSPDSFPNVISLNNPGLSSLVIESLSTNTTYYFSITALNSSGIESRFSNIVSKNIQG